MRRGGGGAVKKGGGGGGEERKGREGRTEGRERKKGEGEMRQGGEASLNACRRPWSRSKTSNKAAHFTTRLPSSPVKTCHSAAFIKSLQNAGSRSL